MTDSLYNTLAEINEFSDGEGRFVRHNPLLQHICGLLPTPANRISLALMDKCLSNPTGRGKEPSWESVSDMSVDKFNDDTDYYITFYKTYGNKSLWGRVKEAWKTIRGLNSDLNEIVLTKEDYQKLKNF